MPDSSNVSSIDRVRLCLPIVYDGRMWFLAMRRGGLIVVKIFAPKIIARALLLAAPLLCQAGGAGAQQVAPSPILALGNAVVTGFSGVMAPDPRALRPPNKTPVDLTFINPDGPSVRIVDLSSPGYVWDGRLWAAAKPRDVLAKDTGQVFGIALDDQPDPNIYLAATSAFGLNLVGRGRDGMPERRKVGGPGTGWMKGQFGLDLQGGPGSIYKVDGTTGMVSLLANVMLDGVPNPGPGLGGVAYDSAHKQLFVSDLYTGMVHRFAVIDGSELGPPYDHGVTGRGAANLAPVPFNPGNRPNIADSRFNAENPDTWGFATPERRVWGLAVQAGRLFYSARNGAATEGPQVWSVGVQQDGSFAPDARWELDVPAQPGPYPVADIAFSQKGAMILAQRAPIAASYDYSAFTRPGEPRVLRYWLKDPRDPPSPGLWKPAPEEYAIGFAGTYRNTNGGVALGYGYGPEGTLSATACEAALWTTGQNLRNNPALRSRLDPGGALLVDGLQGAPADMVRNANEPPWTSYFVDYDDRFDEPRASGHLGGVRVFAQPCAGANAVAGQPGLAAPVGPGGIPIGPGGGPVGPGGGEVGPPGGGGCVGPNCLPINLAIKKSVGDVKFDAKTGTWTFQFTLDVINAGNPFAPTNFISISDPVTAGLTFVSAVGTSWFCPTPPPALTSGNLNCAYNFGPGLFNSAAHLNPLVITVTTKTPGKYENCATVAVDPTSGLRETTLKDNRDCRTVEIPPKPVNVAIVKTGVLVPVADMPQPGFSNFSYTLAVSNIGAAFNGTNAITVTDVVPAGMTFSGATGTNWTCNAPPAIPAPGTLTCTYTGTGPTAPGPIGTITITAAAKGDGPWKNCADVAIAAGTGTDSDLHDNTSCITLTAGGFIPVNPPPPAPTACGFNVIFVVDQSGSMAPYTTQVTSALANMASIFNRAGSQAALIRFSDAATLTPMATSTYGTINAGYTPAGATNWQAAMQKATALLPSANTIVVFITDGDPNEYTDSGGTVQFTTNPITAANAAIPFVNQIYAAGIPIYGFGVGSASPANMNALLGGNLQMTSYGGLSAATTTLAQKMCPGLYLTKSIAPQYVDYHTTPSPGPVTITLGLTNTGGPLTNVIVHDDLPPELTSPIFVSTSAVGATTAPLPSQMSWTIPTLAATATETLNFTVTLAPNPVPTTTASTWHNIVNYAQVTSVNGVAELPNGQAPPAPPHLMANPVTGPVHEPDEAEAQIYVYNQSPQPPQYCTASQLWVTKTKTGDPEVCLIGGSCSFQVKVTATCTQYGPTAPGVSSFSGPVVFGDGVLPVPGTSTTSDNNLSITSTVPSGASMSSCATNATWSPSSSLPSICNATVTLPLNQSIVFGVTMDAPSPVGSYKNCFLADGKSGHPTTGGFSAVYPDVNPPTSPNGGLWGDCAPLNVEAAGHSPVRSHPVDVAIAKTGGTSPVPQVNGYAFHLAVTNVAAAFNGTNAITVTDVVPAGMTFDTATGTNWSCATLPVAAGGTLTCTYTGTGPAAPNQALGTIDISATAAGSAPFPPFTNCATVGLTPASTLEDTNPANNRACVTVVKPAICPSPMVPGAVAGQCVCPAGTTLVGGACIRPITCGLPLVPGAVAGQCVCPQGTVQRGRECIRPTTCLPPLVPGAVAGQCVCPQGTVQRGGKCVRPTTCLPPLVPGAVAGQCVCPQGTVQRGRECVRPTTCLPPMVPGAVAGQCVCPQGTVQRGRECVRQIACQAPTVPNAAGTACTCPPGTISEGNRCVQHGSPQQSPNLPQSGPYAPPGGQQNGPRDQQPGPTGTGRGSPTR